MEAIFMGIMLVSIAGAGVATHLVDGVLLMRQAAPRGLTARLERAEQVASWWRITAMIIAAVAVTTFVGACAYIIN